ncbi:MAG: DUF3570 domain-containing protein [Betaproteobacteria bacterium]
MASVAAAVAATEDEPTREPRARRAVPTARGLSKGGGRRPFRGDLIAAALALPGIVPGAAAQAIPDEGVFSLRYLDYRDWQTGADRMRVKSPSLFVMKPFGGQWVAEGSLVYDGMSGASPRQYNTLSGASGEGVKDYRTAGDAKVTRYFDRYAIGFGVAGSTERDFLSKAASVDVRWWTEDRNTTVALSFAGTSDRINSNNEIAVNEKRNTLDLLVGVTQAINANAIVQSNLAFSRGHGYYDDPYKSFDDRPGRRNVVAWLTRWNQAFPERDATLKVAFRLLHDSFGSDSTMVEGQWVQGLPLGFTVSPGLRYYTQSAADFYRDPPFPNGLVFGEPYTADTRLSAFGAFTPSLKVAKAFADGWIADLRVDFYRQKGSWRLGGDGSPRLLPFSARWIQGGVSKSF